MMAADQDQSYVVYFEPLWLCGAREARLCLCVCVCVCVCVSVCVIYNLQVYRATGFMVKSDEFNLPISLIRMLIPCQQSYTYTCGAQSIANSAMVFALASL